MIGDPHIVTLDQLRYTFNGEGEYTLIQTPDSSFTLQGRMVPFPGGTPTRGGTVFSAVAARVGVAGDRVMVLSAGNGEASVYVNDKLVELSTIPERSFDNFTVSLGSENGTVTLRFGNGVYLECRVDRVGEYMTGVVVGIPRTFTNKTRGLLGVFNGVQNDDLLPAASSASPLPMDSDLRTIHDMFGLTCKYESEVSRVLVMC